VRAGVALPFGDTDSIPISESYFAGGDSTLRGFPRDGVGPSTGGEALFLVNQEYRFPIWDGVVGVVFYDTGNVYADSADIDLTDLRHVLGAGVRYETPIGPLRLEYGRKLDREPGESLGELFFTIGSAF
jgi:outer membrane protein insertion porin family